MEFKKSWNQFWHFIWEEDTPASWIANIILAFVLIKFIVYPGLGFLLGTTHPVVAVVSGSMEHDGSFATWWTSGCSQGTQEDLYRPYSITADQFQTYSFRNGFNKGDIMVLSGHGMIQQGDVIVFSIPNRSDPIIHRVIGVTRSDEQQLYKTKGDHNCGSAPFEDNIGQPQIIGKAVLRIPYLGWVKLVFSDLLQYIGVKPW